MVLIEDQVVNNGPKNKISFNYGSIAEVSTFSLLPTYKKDSGWSSSKLKTEYQNGVDHWVFNFVDDGDDNDAFDLQINFFIK